MIINFTFDTKFGKYSDCLHLDDEHTFTEEEIEGMKTDRLNNWLYSIEMQNKVIPGGGPSNDYMDIIKTILDRNPDRESNELTPEEIEEFKSLVEAQLLEMSNNNSGV